MISRLIEGIILYILIIIFVLLSVAVFTLVERKIMGLIQRRRGPNVVGFFGILQPFADGIKLFLKECIIPSRANRLVFIFAPILALSISFLVWLVIPLWFQESIISFDVSILYILALLSLNSYSIVLGGWASNSKYAFLGAIRGTAQMISYEIAMGLNLFGIVLNHSSLSLDVVSSEQCIYYFNALFMVISFILFYICFLAETYRTPFDFTEAEGELVSGFNVEYSSMGFALFFLGEYANIIFMAFFMSVVFFGGVYLPVILVILFITVWLRSTLPRYRYDQLMRLGWRVIMPLALLNLMIISIVIYVYV